jgi:hypothetical protein
MITGSHLEILLSILNDNCIPGKVVTRNVLFEKFESKAKSGMEVYKFKKALSFLIDNGTIKGYQIKRGRRGGVFKVEEKERIAITCSFGKFIGDISKPELSQIISKLKKTRTSYGHSTHRS